MTAHPHSILIVDFGSQVTQLIARRVREAGVYSEIAPFNSAAAAFARMRPSGIILSGGPASVLSPDSPRAPQILLDSGLPILAICYGQQTLCTQLGGLVEGGHAAEFGRADVEILKPSPLFDGLWSVGGCYPVWMSHGDRVTRAPAGFEVVGTSPNAPFAICVDETRRYYTTMFHPEVVHTPDGAALIANFVHRICGLAGDWTMAEYRATKIADIRAQVGGGRVICGLSGGVDSSVAAILIHEAVGDQLTCVFVDHGLLRHNERAEVEALFRGHYNIPLVVIDAEARFLAGLAGVTDPEAKRKFIGGEFIAVFEEEANKLGGADFLAQGTLYPDVIESVSFTGGPSVTIKSHHNVGGLPERMNMALVEPLARIVQGRGARAWARAGPAQCRPSSAAIPFPGPGLAIRMPRRSDAGTLATSCAQADAVYLDEIRKAGLYDVIWQAFAVLLPVRSVGVMGDGRTYDNVLRAARRHLDRRHDRRHLPLRPAAFLSAVATRIINEVKGDQPGRLRRDTSKPPGTIEWE